MQSVFEPYCEGTPTLSHKSRCIVFEYLFIKVLVEGGKKEYPKCNAPNSFVAVVHCDLHYLNSARF